MAVQNKEIHNETLGSTMKKAQLGTGVLSAPGRRAHKLDAKHSRHQHESDSLDPNDTEKVLRLAKMQRDEDSASESGADVDDAALPSTSYKAYEEFRNANGDDDEEEEDEDEGSQVSEEEINFDDLDIDPADAEMLAAFSGGAPDEDGPRTISDLIFAKLREHEEAKAPKAEVPIEEQSDFDKVSDKVVQVYSKVGDLLSRYKSGPLPKAFKILPTLPMWHTILMMTEPERWTPHALYAATRLFVSNLPPREAQKFIYHIFMPKIRDELSDTGKLSVHSFEAMKRSVYKPQAFFKGFLFPLCESGTCTLKEANIYASVLSRISIPVLHSGAALMKLAQMPYSGPTSIFIRVLLDKKYALPYKVIDALVFYFMGFRRTQDRMPVLWHQSLLVFVQRYKGDMAPEQRDVLLDVIRVQSHHEISPEIRRELSYAANAPEAEDSMDVEVI